MNLKLKLLLQMVNNLSRPAKDARRDLKGIKTEADTLKNATAGNKLASDIEKIGAKAKAARRDLAAMGAAAKQAGNAGVGGGRRGRAEKSAGKEGAGSTVVAAGGRKLIGGAVGYYATRAVAKKTIGAAVDFEKEMADVKKKVDLPEGQNWSDIEKIITDSAMTFGKSRAEVARLTAELGAAGIGYQDLGKHIARATRAGLAWDMTANEAGQKLMQVRAGLNYNDQQLDDYIDKVNALSDAGASKERDVVEMAGRSAAAAKKSGVSEDVSMAFLTGMNAVGINAEVASRGFNAMVSKLRTAKSNGGDKMKEGLKMLGLTPEGVEKGMKTDALKTLTDLLGRFAKAKDQAAAGVKIFGAEWWDEFARMAEAAPEIKKYIDILSSGKWRGSAQKSVNEELRTTANHLEKLKTLAEAVGERLGKWALPPINDSIEKLLGLMKRVDEQNERSNADAEIRRKVATGEQLSEDDRRRLAAKPDLQKDAAAQKKSADNYAETGRLQKDAEIADLRKKIDDARASLGVADPSGNDPRQKARRDRLAAMEAEYDSRANGGKMRPADRNERSNAAQRAMHDASIKVLDDRIRSLESLARLIPAKDPSSADQQAGDIYALANRRAQHHRDRHGPAGGPFEFGNQKKPMQMPGSTGGKPSGFNFMSSIKDRFSPDMQADGAAIMDSLKRGMEGGKGAVLSTASDTKDGLIQTFAGMDASAQGMMLGASLAAGISASKSQVVAAARDLAQSAQAEVSKIRVGGGGGSVRGKIGGGLHDGGAP